MLNKLKELGFKAQPHPQKNRDILIKVERGEVEITKLKKFYHIAIHLHDGGGGHKNCYTEDEVISFLDNYFMRKEIGVLEASFSEIFPFK